MGHLEDSRLTADLTMASDGTLSGTVTGKRGTATLTTGWVSVEKFSFTVNILLQGEPFDVIFTGTFEKDSMKGTLAVPGFSIDFTGTKPGAQLTTRAEE